MTSSGTSGRQNAGNDFKFNVTLSWISERLERGLLPAYCHSRHAVTDVKVADDIDRNKHLSAIALAKIRQAQMPRSKVAGIHINKASAAEYCLPGWRTL